MRKYMIIERFHPGKAKELYQRYDEKGRLLPPGVKYIDSWIDEQVQVCFQLMESETREALQACIDVWSDVCDFDEFPVIGSAEAREKVNANLKPIITQPETDTQSPSA